MTAPIDRERDRSGIEDARERGKLKIRIFTKSTHSPNRINRRWGSVKGLLSAVPVSFNPSYVFLQGVLKVECIDAKFVAFRFHLET